MAEEQEEGVEDTEAHPRGKRGFGFRGQARAEAHHNFERVLSAQLVNATILNYIMVANRTVALHEDMINRALGTAHLPRRLNLCGWTLTHTRCNVPRSVGGTLAHVRHGRDVLQQGHRPQQHGLQSVYQRCSGASLGFTPRGGVHLANVDVVRVLLPL